MRISALFLAVLIAPSAALAAPYAKVATVTVGGAAGGGEYASPVEALDALATWCGTPSDSNRCLVKVMPGLYDIGSRYMMLNKPFVDIEGSGADTTVVRGVGASLWGVMRFYYSSNNELRSLSLEKSGGGLAIVSLGANARVTDATIRVSGGNASYDQAVSIQGTGSMILDRVTIAMAGGATVRSVQGINAHGTSATLDVVIRGCSIDVSGAGEVWGVNALALSNVKVLGSSIRAWGATGANGNAIALENRSATQVSASALVGEGARSWGAVNGQYAAGAILKVDGSQLTATSTVYTTDGQSFVGASRLDGGKPIIWGSGSVRCVNSYDGAYVSLNEACQ